MRHLTSLLLLAVVACSSDKSPVSRSLEISDAAAKAAWIEKVAAALRNGEGIGEGDDMDELMTLSQEDIVTKLMADSRFGDTVLAFNLFYLGRSVNQIKTPVMNGGTVNGYEYAPMVQSMPQALASAHAVVKGGDFFELLSGAPSLLLPPLKKPNSGEIEVGLTDAQKRQLILTSLNLSFDATIGAFTLLENAAANKQAGCNTIGQLGAALSQKLTQAGFDNRLSAAVNQRWIAALQTGSNSDCSNPPVTTDVVMAKVKKFKEVSAQLFAAADNMSGASSVQGVGDMAQVSINVDGLPPLVEPMTADGFWGKLRNSSTNYNRKRSAYMLRTYFCDDLSPINVAAPAEQGEGAHGTQQTCMACHYKLDPMGGLFRYNGTNGTNYQDQQAYTFDDAKTIAGDEYAKYLKNWQGEEGQWLAGYFIGAKKPHPKWQGDKLSDLWPFLKQSTEVKQCLVRRMAEYFLGPDQVYDGGWLEEISKPLKAGPTSAVAFKQVIASLVVSKTFANSDPEPGTCYDFASGDAGGERAPCEIDHIVKKRCATCHSDAAETAVDFTKWGPLADGKPGFLHLNDNGTKKTQAESFQLILDRITSADPEVRMPLNSSMPEMDRQILYKWLDKTLNPNQ